MFNQNRNFLKLVNANNIFILLLLVFAFRYEYPSILMKRPQSVHHWRQSDCASMAMNYYQTGMHFFRPQTHNLTSDNNTSGYCATSELPLIYYTVAILYKIFGYHDFIYRLLNTFIFLLGLFYLFKLCLFLFNDLFWSAFVPLLFFTSPVLVYYGNNFLTDTDALAFGFIAWYFFFKFLFEKKQLHYFISMFFMLMAGACKITALISLVAIACLYIFELLNFVKFRDETKIFDKPLLGFLPFVCIGLSIGSWTYFAKSYNLQHHTNYFSTGILPIWNLDKDDIHQVLHNVKELWFNQYFHPLSLYFFAALFVVELVYIKVISRLLMSINLLLFLGVIIYAVLWFSTFKDHDYYTINLYIFLVFTLLNALFLLKARFPNAFRSSFLKITMAIFLIFNLNHAHKQMKERYLGWWNEYPAYKSYHSVTPYLRSIGILPLDTVVCLPDMSHFTLYLMNQRGTTECLGNNTDSSKIASSVKKGAKYLIVNGKDVLNRKYLQSYLQKPIGQFDSIRIFKLL